MSLNTNTLAINTANTLQGHYERISESVKRLSSGLRVNSASDDAAGLAIRELMRSSVAALHQGVRNAQDAISMIQVADGALAIIDEKLIRMKELAEQAATGTYDSTQRQMISSEFNQMAEEINRIARATDFNGIKLLDGSLSGEHDGTGLNFKGAMKIHFGAGNESAEDYYYVNIGDASITGLFGGNGSTRAVAGFEVVKPNIPVQNTRDNESQNSVALPNGNVLILTSIHSGPQSNIHMYEYDSSGTLVADRGSVAVRPGSGYSFQPEGAVVLPNGNVTIGYLTDGYVTDSAFNFVTYDSSWNQVGKVEFTIPKPPGLNGNLISMNVTSGSMLATAYRDGVGVQFAMTDLEGKIIKEATLLGPGGQPEVATLNGKHFVVTQNGSNLQGYFVDDNGTASSPINLGEGAGPKITALGDKVVLVYSKVDAETKKTSTYGKVVNADGIAGNEFRLNKPDTANNNSPLDIKVMRDEDGNFLEQVVVSWMNSAGMGTQRAGAFTVANDALTPMGEQDIEFVTADSRQSLYRSTIEVLNDGTIIVDWQRRGDVGTDSNYMAVVKVKWADGNSGGGELQLICLSIHKKKPKECLIKLIRP